MSLTQEEWLKIFTGDILVCKTEAGLRRWGENFSDEIKQKCPEHVAELREKYLARLEEIKSCAK